MVLQVVVFIEQILKKLFCFALPNTIGGKIFRTDKIPVAVIERTQPMKALHACVLFQNIVEGNGEVCFRNSVEEFSKNVIAAPQCVLLLRLECSMIDADGDTVFFKNVVLDFRKVLA